MSNSINNVKPSNRLIKNTAPKNGTILNLNPKNTVLQSPNYVYMESHTIQVGQPLPWGINWAITYSATMTFPGVRP